MNLQRTFPYLRKRALYYKENIIMTIEKQNESKPRVLILGATGRTGSKVITELERTSTVQVVYASRKLAQVEAWRRDGKDAVLLDLDQPETFPDLHRLRRVVERMRADLATNLDLKTLAAESGYSRNQFLRMFRTATESTPHQFFLQLRVEKARSLMKNKSLRIIDIAASCGFGSQAHFSRVFRQIVGVTPRHYRREIS